MSEVRPVSVEPEGGARRARILLIDDDRDLTTITSMLLEQKGYDVLVAHDGSGGVEQAMAGQPDLVLCDLRLQGDMDGYAVARALRARPETSALRIYALTGFCGDEVEVSARAAGFDAVVTKADDCFELVDSLIASL